MLSELVQKLKRADPTEFTKYGSNAYEAKHKYILTKASSQHIPSSDLIQVTSVAYGKHFYCVCVCESNKGGLRLAKWQTIFPNAELFVINKQLWTTIKKQMEIFAAQEAPNAMAFIQNDCDFMKASAQAYQEFLKGKK